DSAAESMNWPPRLCSPARSVTWRRKALPATTRLPVTCTHSGSSSLEALTGKGLAAIYSDPAFRAELERTIAAGIGREAAPVLPGLSPRTSAQAYGSYRVGRGCRGCAGFGLTHNPKREARGRALRMLNRNGCL